MITDVAFDEDQKVVKCLIEAIKTNNEYAINWRTLKDPAQWRIGWH